MRYANGKSKLSRVSRVMCSSGLTFCALCEAFLPIFSFRVLNSIFAKHNSFTMIPIEKVEQRIFLIRGHKVMLDRDLAVTKEEFENLIFHSGTSSWGGPRKLPRAFTEHGILSLSSVLKSKRAVQVNIAIMRTFVKLRQWLSTHKELAEKLSQLERRIEKHGGEIHAIFEAIRRLMVPPETPKRRIGFHP